eukprot:CAMPEP_0115857776 /NCGR_PEP_ID=MMETSP0287-20121206/15753_1 /TAXON_ID=412157 /ORGANISM="Chrysochromulina rotalis, Strain UIO044" /LENGTH=288 /DNA_ID=CAMNT_0003312013 /DNA_START=36 /DNA_END=902 /DNA_ORIENTATION=-
MWERETISGKDIADWAYTWERTDALLAEALPMLISLFMTHFMLHLCCRKLANGDWRMKDGTSGCAQVAYNTVVLMFDIVSVLIGLQGLVGGSMSALSSARVDRLYGYSSVFSLLNSLTTAFEVYNTIVCLCVTPQGIALVAHHVCTLALCFIATAPYVHFYGLFFIGLANLSSIPLAAFTVCDALRMRNPAFEQPYVRCRMAFAGLFLLVRVTIWPCVSAVFWYDTIATVIAGHVRSKPATLFLLLSNIFLTSLQFMWGRKVYSGIKKALSAEKRDPGSKSLLRVEGE